MNPKAAAALKAYRESGAARTRKRISHTVKTMENKDYVVEHYTKSLAIKLMCTRCFGFEGNPKALCTSVYCPLYPYRGITRTARSINEAENVPEPGEATEPDNENDDSDGDETGQPAVTDELQSKVQPSRNADDNARLFDQVKAIKIPGGKAKKKFVEAVRAALDGTATPVQRDYIVHKADELASLKALKDLLTQVAHNEDHR